MDQVGESGIVTTIIHFSYIRTPEPILPENAGEQPWRIACMPKMVELHQTKYHPNYLRTNDPRAVTCPSCMNTDAYKHAMRPYQ